MNEHESAAMWKLYARTSEAIAIQSTYRSLQAALPNEKTKRVHIGVVQYINYDKDKVPEGNLYWPFVHKRLSFEHERELRAVYHDQSESPPEYGQSLPVDVEELIHRIFVAPSSPPWFAKLVRDVVRRYGLNKDVVQSALDSKPLH